MSLSCPQLRVSKSHWTTTCYCWIQRPVNANRLSREWSCFICKFQFVTFRWCVHLMYVWENVHIRSCRLYGSHHLLRLVISISVSLSLMLYFPSLCLSLCSFSLLSLILLLSLFTSSLISVLYLPLCTHTAGSYSNDSALIITTHTLSWVRH